LAQEISKKSKIIFALNDFICYIWSPLSGSAIVSYMFALNTSTIEFLLFGLSWSLTYGFWCTYSSNIILQQIIHFYLVCEIFKQRLRAINEHLSGMKFDEIPTNEKNVDFLSNLLMKFIVTLKHIMTNIGLNFFSLIAPIF